MGAKLSSLVLTGFLAGGCVTTQDVVKPGNLESELGPKIIKADNQEREELNLHDSFSQMCFLFGGDYCQVDCALLRTYYGGKNCLAYLQDGTLKYSVGQK